MAGVKAIGYWSWKQGDPKGGLKVVGCMTNGTTIIVTTNGFWKMEDEDDEFTCVHPCAAEEIYGRIFSLCFDLVSRVYIASEKRGLEVHGSLEALQDDEKPCAHVPDFVGPVNLSHPSTGLIGVNNAGEKEFGTLQSFSWKEESWSPETHTLYDKKFKSAVFLVLLAHQEATCTGLSDLPRDILLRIFAETAPPRFSLTQKIHDTFWSPRQSWLINPTTRKPVTCLRRSWYPTSILWYFVDEGGWREPDDGIRCLWTINTPGNYNEIQELRHTFMNSPSEGLPFCIEIPHEAAGEVLIISPRWIAVDSRPAFGFPEFRESAKYNWIVSATDREGSSKARSKYVVGYEREEEGEKEWFVFELGRR
jgi:hypothetical protein